MSPDKDSQLVHQLMCTDKRTSGTDRENAQVLIHELVRLQHCTQTYGLACSKAGVAPLQGASGGFDSLPVHKMNILWKI